jgi:hypothetical protein
MWRTYSSGFIAKALKYKEMIAHRNEAVEWARRQNGTDVRCDKQTDATFVQWYKKSRMTAQEESIQPLRSRLMNQSSQRADVYGCL